MLLTHVLPLALSLSLSNPLIAALFGRSLGFFWGGKRKWHKNMARIFTKNFLKIFAKNSEKYKLTLSNLGLHYWAPCEE